MERLKRLFRVNLKIHIREFFELKNLYSVLIAMLPLISFYKVPVLEFGFSTLILGATLPYVILVALFNKSDNSRMLITTVWISYFIIRSFGNAQSIFLLVVVFSHISAAYMGSLSFNTIRKTIEFFSFVMTAFILVQFILNYAFGMQISFLNENMILDDNKYYVENQVTMSGLYRPSAFFLEPSHYAQYCSIGLLSSLFPIEEKRVDLFKSCWIAAGILLTTSGIGLVLTVCIFIWYFIFNKNNSGREKVLTVLISFTIAIVVFLLLLRMPFFKGSIDRILDNGYSGAIFGRTGFWKANITPMSTKDFIVGYGAIELPENYMTGLMSIIYRFGIIGVILYALVIVTLAVRAKNNFCTCYSIMTLGLLVVANLTDFIQMIFILSIIISSGSRDYDVPDELPQPENAVLNN